MKFVAGFCFCLLLLVTTGLVLVYSGIYDVGAIEPRTPLVRWLAEAGKHRSVQSRADEIATPVQFSNAQIRDGFAQFRATCVTCHGAPGVERSEAGLGLQPPAPKLEDVATKWTAAEMFWIVKNGIRMSGMPAFGPTHRDDEIWAVVAFSQKLPAFTAEDYRRLESGVAGDVP